MAGAPRIMIFAALEAELRPLWRQAARWSDVALTRTGPGAERGAGGVRSCVEYHEPRLVVHLGFAGALDPTLRTGDLLRIGRVTSEAGEQIVLDPTRAATRLLSIDRIVANPAEKARLFKERQAVAVDMETFAVAREMESLGVPLIALRAITDTAGEPLPRSSLNWVTREGETRVLRPLAWAITHPWRIGDLVRLARASKLAAARLADEAELIIREHL